ncbi:MAG: protein-L-isoaspartate(D-aspartate) O-methyltransferase [Alphaproteobacteria bacterium]|nr:protein-L-isoaspartate(D-aspartate) O-methyltransferase [Alphaproteobacteria bacterium]
MSVQATRKIRLIMELRKAGIVDKDILAALERVPREDFVPTTFSDQAYEDTALPIGCGQTISQPLIVGMMTQALKLGDRMKVLEIGTGSGYQTAVLTHLARRVYSIERHKDLLLEAEGRLKKLGRTNWTTKAGDGYKGWPEQAPFDRIIVTAAAEDIPQALIDQLAEGGIMVAPIGRQNDIQTLVRFTKHGDELDEEELSQVRFVPMVHGLPGEPGQANGTGI